MAFIAKTRCTRSVINARAACFHMSYEGQNYCGNQHLKAIRKTRLNIRQRDICRAFREVNGHAPARLQCRWRTHRATVLRIEQGCVTTFERALRTQYFEPRGKRFHARNVSFMLTQQCTVEAL